MDVKDLNCPPPYIGFGYCLNAFQIQYLAMVAERRNCGKQPNGVVNKKCDSQNDFSINFQGVIGEFVVTRLVGGSVSIEVSLSGDDKVSDLIVNGMKIQVKTNMGRWPKLYLYFDDIALFKAEVAVLAVIRSATEVTLLGWVTKNEFIERSKKINFGHGERDAVESVKLNPISTLEDFIYKK